MVKFNLYIFALTFSQGRAYELNFKPHLNSEVGFCVFEPQAHLILWILYGQLLISVQFTVVIAQFQDKYYYLFLRK